jgi:hypothetical protein
VKGAIHLPPQPPGQLSSNGLRGLMGRAGDDVRHRLSTWIAPVNGRWEYVTHAVAGHAVAWTRSTVDGSCPGDIVCDDCGQVLWCRAYDPWRAQFANRVADHWGAARPRPEPRPLLTVLNQVLRLADRCPRHAAGDRVRRMACELIEARTTRERHSLRRRILATLARLDRSRVTPEERATVQQLIDIMRDELPGVTSRDAGHP